MRNLVPLLLIGGAIYTFPAHGCNGSGPKAYAEMPGFAAVSFAEVAMTRDRGPAPSPDHVPRAQCTHCNGTGRIVHGDGHSTECPHCYAFFGPVPLEETQLVNFRLPLTLADHSECDCEKCECSPCRCAAAPIQRVALRQGCSSGSCGTAGGGSCGVGPAADSGAGNCNSGSCATAGAGSDGPRMARGPVRRVGGFFRERRPVRRFFGRLFGRGGCG